MRSTPLAALLLTVACASTGSRKPADTPAAPGTAAPSGAAASEAPAPAPAPAPPAATVESFAEQGDETLAKILFTNPTAHECEFKSYTLTWPGGKKRVDAKEFHVPAGGKRERSLRLHKNDGDVSSLNKDSAHVEIETDCGGS